MGVPGSVNNLLGAGGAPQYLVERSLRFSSSDSAYLSRTPSTAGNRKTWTWAGWVKRGSLDTGTNQVLFSGGTGTSDSTFTQIDLAGTNTLRVTGYSTDFIISAAVFRDVSAWYHIVVAFDATQGTNANKLKVYINGSEIAYGTDNRASISNQDYGINQAAAHALGRNSQNSARYFDGYLADIHFIDGQALTPSSFTEVSATTGQLVPKQYTGSFGTNGFWLKFSDNSAATATTLGKDYSGNSNNWTPNNLSVTGLVDHTPAGLSYRDSSTASRTWDQSSASSSTSAAIGPDRIYWVDLGASKSFNRITFSVVASGQSSDTSTNFISYFSTSSSSTGSTICGGGCTVTSASRPSATTPGTITVTFAGFASQTGRYIGITNGSGAQGGTYTYSNFKVYDDQGASNDSLVDTPTSYGTDTSVGGEVRGNYATLNPLAKGSAITLANGNLDWSETVADAKVLGTIGMSSGKWYWEVIPTATNQLLGIATQAASLSTSPGYDSASWAYASTSGQKVTNSTGSSYGASYTTNDVIGFAFDADNGTLTFYKNGSSQGQAFSGLTSGPYFPAVGNSSTSGSANFGQRPWAYTPPANYRPLVDTLLPTPVVAKPSTVMDVALWTGNGSARSITGLGFNPDLVWIKGRSGATDHALYDVVRGAQARLESNTTDAEVTSDGGVTAFNSDGFSLGTLAQVNTNAATYAGWCFDAGSNTVSNTAGSITSSVRANVSAGFSIVTYTGNNTNGATVGHGLGVTPSMIIIKNRSSAVEWIIYHISKTSAGDLRFDTTTGTTADKVTATSSTTFTVADDGAVNGSSTNHVAYCFSPVAGYSSFGSYTGNGSADGPFVYTGFRPRWVMIKRSDSTNYWIIQDAARNGYNVVNLKLAANTANVENDLATIGDTSQNTLDYLSNGFKCRTSNAGTNASGGTYVWAAFAESPFAYARAR